MRNKKTAAVAGLAAIMLIGGTFAYFNQTMTINNPFSTGKYDSVVKEDFSPGEDTENWVPGAMINKDVEVKNTGDYDLFVRVKFDEKWTNKDAGQSLRKELKNLDGTTNQVNAIDGLIADDGSVVEKIFNSGNRDKWEYRSDGYWYYKVNLKAGNTTGTFLDAVKLMEDADMGKYITSKYYTTQDTAPDETDLSQWILYDADGKGGSLVPDNAKHNLVVTKQDPNATGYGNADYTLSITVETVQATESAMKAAFGLTDKLTGWVYMDKDLSN